MNEQSSVPDQDTARDTEPQAASETSAAAPKLSEADEQIILDRLRELGYVE